MEPVGKLRGKVGSKDHLAGEHGAAVGEEWEGKVGPNGTGGPIEELGGVDGDARESVRRQGDSGEVTGGMGELQEAREG